MVISSYLIARMTKQVAESVEQEYTVAAATTAAHEFFSCMGYLKAPAICFAHANTTVEKR
jgi:hypothetical protein